MNEYIYELKNPIQYAWKGEQIDASFITLFEPNYKQLNHVVPIKQAFMSAITGLNITAEAQEIAKKDTDDSDSAMTGESVTQLFLQWNGDLTAVYKNAEKVFKAGGAKLDGQEPINQTILDKLSLSDFEAMVGAYIANFIVPSLMGGQ